MPTFLFEHLLVTVVGGSLGLLIGGVTGYALARILIRTYLASERSMRVAVFIPWRTVLAAFLIPFVIPSVVLVAYGIGNMTGVVSVALAVTGLTTAWVCGILVRRELPRSELTEQVAAGRSILTAASALLASFGPYGAWGLGIAMLQRLRLLDHDEAFRIYLLILAAILIFDLGVSVIQYLVMFKGLGMRTEDSRTNAAA